MHKMNLLAGGLILALLGPAWAEQAVHSPLAQGEKDGIEIASPQVTSQKPGQRKGKKPRKNALVLHYEFEKASPAAARNLSGRENNGIVNGKPRIVRGIDGWALRLDGINDYIRVRRTPALEPKKITVAAWVKVREFHPQFSVLARKRNRSFHQNETFDLQIFPGGIVRAVISNTNGIQTRLDASVRIATGLWHHVAMTFSEPELKLYIDGILVGSRNHPYPLAHNSETDLLIGATDHAEYPMGSFMKGDIDELRVYRAALSESEIATLYAPKAAQLPPKPKPAPVILCPPKFPRWQPPQPIAHPPSRPAPDLLGEMERLYREGVRDEAASPEFLKAMRRILDGQASRRLPFSENFDGDTMPPGWKSLLDVWAFENGQAIQVRSWADTRFTLFYAPGRDWQDYSFTFTARSDAWFTPPSRSSLRIYFRFQDRDNGYYLDLINTGEITLSIRQDGKERILRSAKTDYDRVRNGLPWQITVNGNTLLVFQQGKLIVQARDATFSSGTIGMETIHAPGSFSGIAVEPL